MDVINLLKESRDDSKVSTLMLQFIQSRDSVNTFDFVKSVDSRLICKMITRTNERNMTELRNACVQRLENAIKTMSVVDLRRKFFS